MREGWGGALLWPGLGAVALVAAVGLALASPLGLTFFPDSVSYLDAARSLADGNGLVLSLSYPFLSGAETARESPLVTWAPGYPALLALFGKLGAEPAEATRWLGVALLGANVALVGAMAWRITGRSVLAAVSAAAIYAISPAGFETHAYAGSEPLFLLLALGGLALLTLDLERPRTWTLLGSAGLVGLAVLTRYAGLPLVGAAVIALLAFGVGEVRRRALRASAFAALSTIPLALWLVRNIFESGTATGREAVWHPPPFAELLDAARLVTTWFAPDDLAPSVRALVTCAMLGAIAVAVVVCRRSTSRFPGPDRPATAGLWVLALFGGLYLAWLALTVVLFDALTPLDSRLLAPVYAVGFLLALAGLHSLVVSGRAAGRGSLITAVVVATVSVIAAAYAERTATDARALEEGGYDLSGNDWRSSPAIDYVRRLPKRLVLYSNGPDAIYLRTGRRAQTVPRTVNPLTDAPDPRFRARMRGLGERVRAGEAAVVYFDLITFRSYLPSGAELARTLGLRVVKRLPDGTVYAGPRDIRSFP